MCDSLTGKLLRQALFSRAFNPATRQLVPPPEIAAALDWAARASQRRKRSVFYNALGHGVEQAGALGLLAPSSHGGNAGRRGSG